jgi:uncharacterized membrane protein
LRKSLWICAGGFTVLNVIAWLYRVVDAASYGDWTYAFIQDSFFGYPVTHVLSFVSFAFVGAAFFIIKKKGVQ